jgi:hypothetical protein
VVPWNLSFFGDIVTARDRGRFTRPDEHWPASRPYLLNLVRKGALACRMVGAHHRIPVTAVIAYKREQAPRRRSIEALTAETSDLGH